jgi:hypothetical protein
MQRAPFALLFGAFWARARALLPCPQLERDALCHSQAALSMLQENSHCIDVLGRQLLRPVLFVSGWTRIRRCPVSVIGRPSVIYIRTPRIPRATLVLFRLAPASTRTQRYEIYELYEIYNTAVLVRSWLALFRLGTIARGNIIEASFNNHNPLNQPTSSRCRTATSSHTQFSS